LIRKWWSWSLAFVVISCISITLAGCWDYRELENRAIVVGLGIDELPPARYQGKEMRMYQLLVQIVEPASGGSGGQTGGGMGSQGWDQRGYTNFIIETPSIAEGVERIVTRSDRIPNLAHLQIIALGEKVARKGINELYDFFTRFPQMRRHTEIVVLDGPIPPYFITPSVSEPTPALHIAEMVDSIQRTVIMPESNLGTVSKSVRGNMPFILVYGSLDEEKQIVFNKAAVFHDYKMLGILSKKQSREISILHGEIERGILDFPCYGGKKTGTQVLSGRTKVKPGFRNGHPHVTFEVELETEMVEYQCLGASFDKPEQMKRLEKVLSDTMQKRLMDTTKELQTTYKADVFRLTNRLKNHPALYKMIRDRPREFFEQLTVDVRVDLKIRNIGDTLKTPHRE
jgi:spore germination protein KC